MKSLVLAVMGLLCCMSVSAYDFEVDGIYYNITSSTDKTVEVTSNPNSSNDYSGFVAIPDSVNYNGSTYRVIRIGKSAFSHCGNLTGVAIPNSVVSIGEHAIRECDLLRNVTIPNSVTSIGTSAFSGCDILTKVVIGKSVTSIGQQAFNRCSSLKWVINFSAIDHSDIVSHIIPVDCIDECCFSEIDGQYVLAYYQGNTDTLKLPESYKGQAYSILDFAFSGNLSLNSVEIPEGITRIGIRAFEYSSIKNVVIPTSVVSIGNNAFASTPLKTIVSKSEDPATFTGSSLLFSNYTYIHAPLYVPEDAYWNYAYANAWGDFIHIKEMVTDVSSLQSRKAYMIADSKGCNYKVYDAEKDEMKTVEYTHSLDEESEDCCWTVITENGKTYLYNLGAKKFGVVNDEGALTLSETPVNVTISENENGLSINGANCMFVLNKNVEVEITGINDVLLNGADTKNAQIHSLDGRRQTHATRGINIVNGKKVLVK